MFLKWFVIKEVGFHIKLPKRIITLKYISLVNLIMDKEVVKELIQDELNMKNLKLELNKILNSESRNILLNNYADLKQKLGGEGASKKTRTNSRFFQK